jgi:hypothetical protein
MLGFSNYIGTMIPKKCGKRKESVAGMTVAIVVVRS